MTDAAEPTGTEPGPASEPPNEGEPSESGAADSGPVEPAPASVILPPDTGSAETTVEPVATAGAVPVAESPTTSEPAGAPAAADTVPPSDPAPASEAPATAVEAEPVTEPPAASEPDPAPQSPQSPQSPQPPQSSTPTGPPASPDTSQAGSPTPGSGTLPPPGTLSPPGTLPPPGTPPTPPRVTDAGKIVSGIVTSVTPDELTLNLEDGRQAVLARRHWDLHPIEDLNAVISVHDRVDAAVLARDDPKGRVVLSRSWSLKMKAWEAVDSALESHTSVKARVTSLSAKGVVVDVGGLRGFVPASHLALEPLKDFSEFADQVLELRVLEADQRKERLVLSRRSLLLREQRKHTHDVLTHLEVGSVVTGTVASLADYGAFVDLGGVKGLVHLSELSWQRVGHPRDVVTVGEEIQVKVLDVKVKKRRVSLSIRQIAPDPFAGVVVGSVVSGPVTRLVDFGAFIDLGGVEGLVHLSELAEYRVSAPEEIVTPGEEVMVKVLGVDKRRRRIELSIRQAVSDQYGQ